MPAGGPDLVGGYGVGGRLEAVLGIAERLAEGGEALYRCPGTCRPDLQV